MLSENNLRFSCPNCGQHLEVDASSAGSIFECPTCGQSNEIPQMSRPKITVVKHLEETPNKSSSRFKTFGIVLGVLCVAVGLSILGSSEEDDVAPTNDVPESAVVAPTPIPESSNENSSELAGPRKFVKEHVAKYGRFRICAMTKTGGDIVVCGDNNWASSRCSQDVADALQTIVDAGARITDVSLTECGRYIILYSGNAAVWKGIPSRMEYYLRKYNNDSEVLYSAALNDAGDWIIVSSDHFACSESWLRDWLQEGQDEYGHLLAATVTDDAAVAVYEGGFYFYGNVPSDMKDALRKARFDVRIIKISGSAWFFADANGYNYQAYM